MAYKLRDGLHFCVSGGRTIFFDIPRDRYFALQPAWDTAFQDLVANRGPMPEVDELERAQILIAIEGDCEPLRPAEIIKATREFRPEPGWPFARHSAACIIAQFRAVAWLRICRFEAIISRLGGHAPVASGSRAADFALLSQAFAATASLRPRQRHCLSSSIAYFLMVHKLGLCAKLVMGVCAQPFSAHCWVQCDDTVLNDRLENIEPFQPIFCI